MTLGLVITEIVIGLIVPPAVASKSSMLSINSTVNELLGRHLNQLVSSDSPEGLYYFDCRESPAGATAPLVLHLSDPIE